MGNYWMKYHKPPKMPKRELTALLGELREIARIAKMEGASFGWGDEDDPTEMIKEKTKLWRSTWIISPLEELIERYEKALEEQEGR